MHEDALKRMPKQKVLAFADDDHTRKAIRSGLSPRKFALRLALSPNDGLSSFLKIKPDFVIMSIPCLSSTSILPLREICEADPQARIIVVSDCTDNAFVLECIRHGASDYLRKPLKPQDLQHSIDRISSRNILLKKALEPDRMCVQEESKTLRFDNKLDNLPYIINQAVTNASVVCPDVPMLKMALGEVLLNAIEHGNLGIGMKEKSTAMGKNAYPDLLRERMKDPRYAGKLVTLHVRMTRDRLMYRVIDQGEGFDYKSLFKRDPHASVGSGLGLFVAKSFFTRLTFRGRGNEVVLVYDRPREGA
jgi:DNA-binding NarL/FixJ family response regulator